jgi:Cu+-exporting ATPase
VKYAEDMLGEALEENPFVQPTNFRGITGRGASGVLLGKISVAVGNRSFASVLGLEVPVQADEVMKRLEENGKTAILAAVDGAVVVVLGIADELKSDAAASIVYLRDTMGVDVWMVTGDNSRTAAAVGTQLGISPDRIISEALPAAKLEKVCALQAAGRIVLMVGDGVNDSPALAQADVGMSLGTGAEIATEASDMVLVKGHVADVCTALHLSRTIFRRIKWNLLWSLVYNCLGIPIAAGVFYPIAHTRLPPTLAALAMALSSVSVVLSSLTLRLYRPPTEIGRNRSRLSTRWARTMAARQSCNEVDEMRVNLLSSDHLASSEMTERIDNRTASRLEQGN